MRVILDTGPWVALIDRSEGRHQECIDWLEHFEGEIYTTEAVLTEVLYLVNFSLRAQSAAIEQILLGLMVLVPASLSSLKRSKRLMELNTMIFQWIMRTPLWYVWPKTCPSRK